MCNMRDYVKWDIYERAIEDHIKEKKELQTQINSSETGIKVLESILDDKNKKLEDLKNKYDALYRKYCLLLDKNDELSSANDSLVEKVTVYENGIHNMKESMAIVDMMLHGYDDEEDE
mgnify:CR=1 FL=1